MKSSTITLLLLSFVTLLDIVCGTITIIKAYTGEEFLAPFVLFLMLFLLVVVMCRSYAEEVVEEEYAEYEHNQYLEQM